MDEIWKPVVGLEELYDVSSTGRIRNRRGLELKKQLTRDGYERIGLYADDCKLYFSIHRVVAKAFIPNPEGKPQINHIDGIRTNNSVDNLEWCTQGENMRHAFVLGNKDQKGAKNNGAKLTEKEVIEIREKAKTMLQKDIAKAYGVSKANVCLIVNGKAWQHLTSS